MNNRFLLFIVAFVCFYFPSNELMAKDVKPLKSPKASCRTCHADLRGLLAKDHPEFKGNTLGTCLGCHIPDYAGKAEEKPFSARMHRSHIRLNPPVDCLVCHIWTAQKSFNLANQKFSWGKITKDNLSRLKAIFTSWTNSSYLDSLHAQAKVTCSGCHGKGLPNEESTVENDRCLTCHGSLEKLIAKIMPQDFPERNPHKSHLGDIQCTICHHGHSASKVYCSECHSYMGTKIPGGPAKAGEVHKQGSSPN